jgi:phosphoadenosine phosphosulfate reductase
MSEPAPLFSPLKPATAEPRLWAPSGFAADVWRTIDDDAPLPIAGHAIISLARWRAEQTTLAALGVPIGIVVQPSEALDFEADDISRLAVVALVFPKFTDGRAYSTARRLRGIAYAGEIRATGDVLLDQIPLMLRAGFTSFEITSASTIHALEAASLPAVSRVYQASAESAAYRWQSRPATKRPATTA